MPPPSRVGDGKMRSVPRAFVVGSVDPPGDVVRRGRGVRPGVPHRTTPKRQEPPRETMAREEFLGDERPCSKSNVMPPSNTGTKTNNLPKKKGPKIKRTPNHRPLTVLLLLLRPPAPARGQREAPYDPSNPENKFCGINYDEARQFCHLPPSKSLPCPGGEGDCPYRMPCWRIVEECTPPPTRVPTPAPTESPENVPTPNPMTRRSGDPRDHNYCGLGFNNLFNCAINCRSGSPAECPAGQLCYFDTACDARREPTPPPSQTPTITPKPTEDPDFGVGRYNFCGMTYDDAVDNCHRDRHCPSGNNDECPFDMYCWIDVKDCDIYQLPSMKPTISPKPTPYPTFSPTTRDPSFTYQPTSAPLDPDDIRNFFFCGNSWGDASKRCYKRCLGGHHVECPGEEECFAQAACSELKEEQTPAPTPAEDTPKDPTVSPQPTPMEVKTPEPTNSPLEKDDYRNFFFCGSTWLDASTRCYKRCVSGHHVECPADEECFAQAECRNGVQKPKTQSPTIGPSPAPFGGTLSPTISPPPTDAPTKPQPTMAPVPEPTLSPADSPTESPTTPFPTRKPTYAPCAGEPCKDKEHCRSNQNFCGPGKWYCNEKAIWVASCGIPTDPPQSVAPTTIWPSESPTVTSMPTKFSTPPPTVSPTKLADVVYYLNTNSPTKPPKPGWRTDRPSILANIGEAVETPRPTFGNVNDKYYAPDDPLGTFFCGSDWNQAITECPHRCPSGESKECPNGWACYAFTPCVGIGTNSPPTAKPTWEPTKKPTPKPTKKPTAMPTTTQQYWNQINSELNAQTNAPIISPAPTTDSPQKPTRKPVWWTPLPTPRPSYSPTKDQCRGFPCENEGECRSRLGFCGKGIVYCNSASSWVSSCGGALPLKTEAEETVSPNTEPTPAPSTVWDAWFKGENEIQDDVTLASDAEDNGSSNNNNGGAIDGDAVGVSSASEETGDATPTNSDYDPNAWATNWDSRVDTADKEDEDLRWWVKQQSSSTKRPTGVAPALFLLTAEIMANLSR